MITVGTGCIPFFKWVEMVVEGGLNFLGDFKHPQKKLLSAQDIAWSNSVFLVSRNPRKRVATFAKNR